MTRGGAVWKLVGLINRRSQVQILSPLFYAQIAQLVEQRTENPRVTGSIPVLGTKKDITEMSFFIPYNILESEVFANEDYMNSVFVSGKSCYKELTAYGIR